jgi:ABC-type transporter Mla maintaining outer membrane lipid asymmetry ATPase subunit MlaF
VSTEPFAAAPLVQVIGVRKNYHGLRPLRIAHLSLAASERLALAGLDAVAAEVLVNLLTGATVPDDGEVLILGRSTASIDSEAAWLHALDRLGVVSHRAALLDACTIEQNIALPFDLEIDPIPPATRAQVARLMEEVRIPASASAARAGETDAAVRTRAHLARALALEPSVLLLEHATAALGARESALFGREVAALASRRGLAVLAITEDERFAGALGGRLATLHAATGEVRERKRRWF